MFKICKYIKSCKPLCLRVPTRNMASNEPSCSGNYYCKQPEKDPDAFDVEAYKKTLRHKFYDCPTGKDFKTYRNIFCFICLPAIIAMLINCVYFKKEQKRLKFVKFEHLRLRYKGYVWDPVRTLFHNPRKNALPDGYEVEVPEDEEIEPTFRCCPP